MQRLYTHLGPLQNLHQTMSKPPLIGIMGDINVDQTITMPSFPQEGDDVAVENVRWGSGGAALNQAVAFAQLGATSHLIGRIGTDQSANGVLASAQQAGVSLNAIQHDPDRPTGLCIALVTFNGQRTFCTARGANVALEFDSRAAALLAQAGLLAISSYALIEPRQRAAALAAITLARGLNIPIALDLCLPAIRSRVDDIASLLPHLWLLSLNEAELQSLLPGRTISAAIGALIEAGARCVAVKRGAQGCSLALGGERITALPPAVRVVDTNACGDAFAAGLAWTLLQSGELPEAAEIANLMGALTAANPGAVEAIPTRTTILEALDARLHHLLAAKLPDTNRKEDS